MITFRKADIAEAKALALVSKQAFDNDVQYGAPGVGGPPGYDSEQWQVRMMTVGTYYAIVDNGRLIGGIIIFPVKKEHYELGRIFIHPMWQNQGIGAQAIAFLEKEYPDGYLWTLGTPCWNTRNRHFYKKMGYVETGYEEPDGIRFTRHVGIATP